MTNGVWQNGGRRGGHGLDRLRRHVGRVGVVAVIPVATLLFPIENKEKRLRIGQVVGFRGKEFARIFKERSRGSITKETEGSFRSNVSFVISRIGKGWYSIMIDGPE